MQEPLFSQVVVNIRRLIIYQNVCYNIPNSFMVHICNYDSYNLSKILKMCQNLQNYDRYLFLANAVIIVF